MADNETMTFAISGTVMSTVEGSELYYSPEKYDGGSQGAKDALDALHNAESRRVGKGMSYRVTTTRAGAETIEDYCRTVGETFMFDAESRSEGRALLVVADRIRAMLGSE